MLNSISGVGCSNQQLGFGNFKVKNLQKELEKAGKSGVKIVNDATHSVVSATEASMGTPFYGGGHEFAFLKIGKGNSVVVDVPTKTCEGYSIKK